MSLANYVIGKGVRSLETNLDDETNTNKLTIITEELLYRKLMSQHRTFMFSLLIYHFIVFIVVFLEIISNPII